ncbi:response regulator [PVC group bacterium]|nr:response regulator [PVC group bacterium]
MADEAKKKILVVDDEPQIRKLLRARLEYHNYKVIEGEDGEEALKLLREEKPDLLILDVGMPKMDGYEVCRRIRKEEGISLTPIIVLTARSAGNDKMDSMDAGANTFIVKPFDPELLIFKVKGFFGAGIIRKHGQQKL